MMLKKYVQPIAEAQQAPTHTEADNVAACAAKNAVVSDNTASIITAVNDASEPQSSTPESVIDKFLFDHNIVVLEKHNPEIESELSEISYLLDGIAQHIDATEDLFHTLRKAIATDGKFTYNPTGLTPERLEAVKKVMKLFKLCGIFSELRAMGAYNGVVSTATRVRSFIAGTWLELFSQQHGIEVISEKAKQLNLPYEILCNVKVTDQEGTQHEIDLMFSIGVHVFAVEMKSGLNFMDYDRYRLLAEYLHLIPDRFMLVNSTLLDKDATKCITYFYRYYICNSADYVSTLSDMIDKAFMG